MTTKKPKTVRLDAFVEDTKNVSVATDEDIARLCGKLKRNPRGLVAMRIAYVTDDPPGSRTVNSGNKRLRVLKQIAADGGIKVDGEWLVSPAGDVPAEWFCDITFMTPEQRKEFRINTNISDGKFDAEKLLEQYTLDDLAELMSDDAIDELCKQAEAAETSAEGQTDADAVPETEDKPLSRRGEIYQCGEHRLMCGDATSHDDMLALMQGAKANVLLTDPPYNVGYVGGTKDALTIENDCMDDERFLEFLSSAFTNADAALSAGGAFYIWHAASEGFNFRMAARRVGWRVRQVLVWVKNSLVLGRQDYQWQHEPCLYGWKDGAAHYFTDDRNETTVINESKPARSAEHPTMKPIALISRLVRNSSRRGEVVLDPFGGSGTTLIACEQLGRVCRMMEIDARYCDVIRRRWAEFRHGEGCDWQALTPAIPGSAPAAPAAAPATT